MKTVIVTGASRGIGEAIVRYLLTQGIRVIGVSRSESPMAMLAMEKIGGGGNFIPIVGDIADPATTTKVVDFVRDNHELVGLIINSGYNI